MIRKEQPVIKEHLAGGKGHAIVYEVVSPQELGSAGRLYGRVVLEPGCSVGWHQHTGETEPYYILRGEGTFIDHDQSRTLVHAGDICTIENGQFHSIENNSQENLEFMALIYNLD